MIDHTYHFQNGSKYTSGFTSVAEVNLRSISSVRYTFTHAPWNRSTLGHAAMLHTIICQTFILTNSDLILIWFSWLWKTKISSIETVFSPLLVNRKIVCSRCLGNWLKMCVEQVYYIFLTDIYIYIARTWIWSPWLSVPPKLLRLHFPHTHPERR